MPGDYLILFYSAFKIQPLQRQGGWCCICESLVCTEVTRWVSSEASSSISAGTARTPGLGRARAGVRWGPVEASEGLQEGPHTRTSKRTGISPQQLRNDSLQAFAINNPASTQRKGGLAVCCRGFTEEETGSERSSHLSKVPQQVDEKGRTQTQDLMFFYPICKKQTTLGRMHPHPEAPPGYE